VRDFDRLQCHVSSVKGGTNASHIRFRLRDRVQQATENSMHGKLKEFANGGQGVRASCAQGASSGD
jgi:hypothetical protein